MTEKKQEVAKRPMIYFHVGLTFGYHKVSIKGNSFLKLIRTLFPKRASFTYTFRSNR